MVDDRDEPEGTDRLSGVGLGLVRERTELAWTRSGLAVAVTVAVILRHLWPLSPDRTVIALVVVAAIAVCWVVAAHLARVRLSDAGGGGLSVTTVRVVTYGTLALAAVGVVVSFL
jgi:hypothetical protein